MNKNKIWTKISFYTLLFGWFPFMWICGWGLWQTAVIRVAVMIIGLLLCMFASMMILPLLKDEDLFKSIDELEEERIKYLEARKRLERKISEL